MAQIFFALREEDGTALGKGSSSSGQAWEVRGSQG